MSMIKDSGHLLGLVPHSKPGGEKCQSYTMSLDPRVPAALGEYFSTGGGAKLVRNLLQDKDASRVALAIHPGGPRILDSLKVPLTNFGFSLDVLDDSYETLYEYGNLGCTAILFVLARVLESGKTNDTISMAFGPGVTVEWGKFERV
jgi:predicted naringenin-chalcone synthase